MKERSVTRRNLVGAFWGGFLGILVAGYLHPAVLPIGCLLGVVVGWWHQEILVHVKRSCLRGVIRTRRSWEWSKAFVLTPVWELKDKAKGLRIDVGPAVVVFHAIMFGIVWLLRRPNAFRCWLRAHPMNRAYFIRVCAVITYYFIGTGLLFLPFYFLWSSGYFSVQSIHDNGFGIFYGLGCLAVGVSLVIIPIVLDSEGLDETRRLRNFYRTWERFAAIGTLRFFFGEVYFLMKVWAFTLAMMILSFLWFAGAGSVFVVCVVVPISAGVGIVKGVYAVSMRAGHWLCFGTTLVVTAITAWLTYPYLGDQRILWIVALCAGLASAGATEAIRRLIVWAFFLSDRLQAMNFAPLDGQLAGWCRLFWDVSRNIERRSNLGRFMAME